MQFVSTRGRAPAASLQAALVEGLAPDGGLYMPQSIEPWSRDDLDAASSQTLIEIGVSALRPYVADDIRSRELAAIVEAALTFPIPLVEVGPTLAFKDVGARIMAGLFSALRRADAPSTILVATSGDTGAAVADAFAGAHGIRVAVLYPRGRVSAIQEAQLTQFNGADGSNVRAFAVSGSFDDCQRLVKSAFADARLRESAGLTSANSINVGRLLPQMIYYFFAAASRPAAVVSVPSGNFGNLCAGVMARRSGAPIASFVAATNANDVVPRYLATGRYEPRESRHTIANAMDCGNPSNFARLEWLYGASAAAMRSDIAGSAHSDEEVRAAIARVYAERGYLLDPHSATAYLGLRDAEARHAGIFLATAHPAKFADILEPIVGDAVEPPKALTAALAAPRAIMAMEPSLDALRDRLGA
jgi:threonine synthase